MSQQPHSPLERNPDDASTHHRTYLRQICRSWEPASIHEALMVAEECFSRAQALTSILVHYTDENSHFNITRDDLTRALSTVEDLLYLGYTLHMDNWMDEEDLMRHGWQPPKTREGRS